MAFITKVLQKVMGDPVQKLVKHYQPKVDAINALEPEYETLSDEALKEKTEVFRSRLSNGETLDDILAEAFACVREASKRTLKMRHFDVQLIGGMVLHEGRIAEMKTGEGKTLVSTLAAYLNALEGKGVYIVTVNDYLAKRDSEWMGEIHTFLGLTIGLIQANMDPALRLEAYKADITYGTNNEYGFDYLRDNLSSDLDLCCQYRRHFAIIDEVDSILIDEARTPLIISGAMEDTTVKYVSISKLVKTLKEGPDFSLEEKHKNVILTDEGTHKLEKSLNLDNMYSVKHMDLAHMAVQCLRALHLYKRDVDYVVKEGEVVIVDEFTGRLMDGRRYSDGLHQAIEAVEGLDIKEESQTLASVTFQNYFRLFPKLAGMTGTALTEASEFASIYRLEVCSIPTNKPLLRDDMVDVVYKSKKEKYDAIVKEAVSCHKKGQPVLVGTISIEVSELLSNLLKKQGIPHNVLNAKNHENEAEIVANAGQSGSVTIATNMAGRGTDIVLGEGVKEAGGLFVIGSERHESRRIDNQLRGRSGRQGDPGASKFFVALDDTLMRLFGSDKIARVMETLGLPDDTPIEHGMITRSIEKAQSKVEKYHFGMRKQILEYDDVLNKQRETIYSIRRQILSKTNLDQLVKEWIGNLVNVFVKEAHDDQSQTEEDRQKTLQEQFFVIFPIEDIHTLLVNRPKAEQKKEALKEAFNKFYDFKVNQFPPGLFEEAVTKRILLMTLDRKWMDHLNNMETLREGIGLRAWGQRDPLIEYKREAFDMFQELLLSVSEEALSVMSRAVLVDQDQQPAERTVIPSRPLGQLSSHSTSAQQPAASQPITKTKIGRNDPCHCGSGKKYKKCCMNTESVTTN